LSNAQTAASKQDFAQVDSLARTIKYKSDLHKLTKDLCSPYSEDILKVRAIFIWITDNIQYDYKFVNEEKEIKVPDCSSGAHCQMLWQEWERKYLAKILKKKSAICDGYTRLLRKMCSLEGIKAEIIGGYSKTKPYQVGMTGTQNHAWNAVWIDSSWHFIDPTWAAGGCPEDEDSGKLLKFRKSFSNYYWFTPFPDFTRNHYPREPKWVLETGYTKEKYADYPYYASHVIEKIKLHTPASGVIKAKAGDTIHFSFDYQDKIRMIQVNSNISRNPTVYNYEKVSRKKKKWVLDTLAMKRQVYIPFIKKGDRFEFSYVVTSKELYYLDILFDYQRAMRFKVTIDSK
ncbi:MAG: transglutaminase domain-containing protein, partial [Pseudobacter sp.]|uniref:transglutaminase domain-containing protein n=1 Tax=Pseudobacter sp. TaxID=2045420 RepID=UPI003F7FF1CB